MPNNSRDRSIADMLRSERFSVDYRDPYSISYDTALELARAASDARLMQAELARELEPATVQNIPVTAFIGRFRDFSTFNQYVVERHRYSGRNYYSDDAIICWNVLAYLQRRNVNSSHRMSKPYAVALLMRASYRNAIDIGNAIIRTLQAFQFLNRPEIRFTQEELVFENFGFTSNFQNPIYPVDPNETLDAVCNAIGNPVPTSPAVPAPVDPTLAAPMLPMPTILPEDTVPLKWQVEDSISTETSSLQNCRTNLEQLKRNLAKLKENSEMIESLFDFPMKEVIQFLQHSDYRSPSYGFDSGADCNCSECRVDYIGQRISHTKLRIGTLETNEISHTRNLERLQKTLEEASVEYKMPAIFMPEMKFACDKLMSVLCE